MVTGESNVLVRRHACRHSGCDKVANPESRNSRRRFRVRAVARPGMTEVAYFVTISGTLPAGGVLRLRWVRTMPSMMVMPMPGRSPS